MNHGERCHGCDTTKVSLRIVLLWVPWANVSAFYVSLPTLVQEITTDVFPNIVPNEDKRDPIAATKVCK
jgi:hypothetical protein